MTEKGYNINEIVAQVRSAGNPQMAAMEAVADNEYLVDSELLEALGGASFGDLPTTPYPDAPMRTRPDNGGQAARPGSPDRRRSPAKSPGRSLGQSAKVQLPKMRRPHPAPCGLPWGGRLAAWRSSPPSGIVSFSDPHGPFSAAQVEALAQIDEAASIWLNGWDVATMILTGGDNHDN